MGPIVWMVNVQSLESFVDSYLECRVCVSGTWMSRSARTKSTPSVGRYTHAHAHILTLTRAHTDTHVHL